MLNANNSVYEGDFNATKDCKNICDRLYAKVFFSTDYNLALYTQTMFWEWSRLLMCIDNVNTLMSAC